MVFITSALLVRSSMSSFFCYLYLTISSGACPVLVAVVGSFNHNLLYWPSMAQSQIMFILVDQRVQDTDVLNQANIALLLSGTVFIVVGLYLHQIIASPEDPEKKHPLFFLNFIWVFICGFFKMVWYILKSVACCCIHICKKRKPDFSKLEVPLLSPLEREDSNGSNDVYLEHLRALEEGTKNLPVRILNLTKAFKSSGWNNKHLAVNKLSLTVQPKECLGLLGPNGSGKTTTLRMLSGHETITSGDAWICNAHVVKRRKQAAKSLGICPQYDGLWPELTSMQHLDIFARIKGVPSHLRKAWCTHILELMDLDGNAKNMRAGTLSGGMARRLSLGVAMVGRPQVLLLDEPTAGLDPGSRRNVWRCIERIKETSQLILTTHSMFEADSLCSRIAIIVNGRLRCIGNQMELKRRIGNGWRLHVIFENEMKKIDLFELFLKDTFSNCETLQKEIQEDESTTHIVNKHSPDLSSNTPTFTTSEQQQQQQQQSLSICTAKFALIMEGNTEAQSLTKLFERLQSRKSKEHFGILEWTISQSSLEEVFINTVEEYS
eukprot:TRINITY_DN1263_c0_g2_i2.p1 TRINITY_DN1263_c0_g2~~TRINITY_DN1263_c0_g2_i2.p1  ORF type:complete len:582 (-),score=169.53 TRINITY_DN1263_c0_g2_i2:322-1968(-)